MNPRPSGYEPDELPAAPPRGIFAGINIINTTQNFKFIQRPLKSNAWYASFVCSYPKLLELEAIITRSHLIKHHLPII